MFKNLIAFCFLKKHVVDLFKGIKKREPTDNEYKQIIAEIIETDKLDQFVFEIIEKYLEENGE